MILSKENEIAYRNEQLLPLLGEIVRVWDSRTQVIGRLKYDKESEKYFINLIEMEKNSNMFTASISFYVLEIEWDVTNLSSRQLRLCEI